MIMEQSIKAMEKRLQEPEGEEEAKPQRTWFQTDEEIKQKTSECVGLSTSLFLSLSPFPFSVVLCSSYTTLINIYNSDQQMIKKNNT